MTSSPSAGGISLTVVVALAANAAVALTKSVVAALSGSASMTAEAAHSWADTGNEVFLLLAERRGARARDAEHPRGYGRATYVWSLVAAFGLFSAGAVVSIWHGISVLGSDAPPEHAGLSYLVLAVAFALEGISLAQATRTIRGDARRFGLHPLRYVDRTSNPTLRAVFLEDLSALVGLAIAAAGIALHQLTGNAVYDALGSIAVGALLALVAVFLMRRNMEYLVGEGVSAETQSQVIRGLLDHPEINRLTYLHAEYVGPRRLFVVAAVDLVGDEREGHVALRLRQVEADIERDSLIEDAVLTLAPPDEPDLVP